MRLAFALPLLLWACGPRTLDEIDPALFTNIPRYATHVAPIYAETCVSCHTSDGLRAGGVELDRYESAYAGRVHQVCTAISAQARDRFAQSLLPAMRMNAPRPACDGWEIDSMPTGAARPLSLEEQVILGRWIETGALP